MDWVSHDQVFAGKSVCWFFWVLSVVSETIYRVESETDPRMTHGENTLRQGEREWESGERERERGREGEELRADACLNNFSWTLFQTPTTATHPLCPSPSAPAPAGRSSCERPRALMRYLTNESTKIITSTPSQVIQLVIERTHENFY